MRIGLGLPSVIAGVAGPSLLEWARLADEAGFSSLGAIDRLVYESYEPVIALTGAAAVTSRIGLMTTVLVGPVRTNTALLAKQLASLDAISGGRLTVGLSIGSRDEDYTAGGVAPARRGRRLEEQIDELSRIWGGEIRGSAGAIGPSLKRKPQILFGGYVEATARRVAAHGNGWIGGGAGPQRFAGFVPTVREAWAAAGRAGAPRLMAIAYFALGDGARERADKYLLGYYSLLGEGAARVAAGAAADEDAIAGMVSAYAELGCDELLFFPCSGEIEQLTSLTDVVRDLPAAELAA